MFRKTKKTKRSLLLGSGHFISECTILSRTRARAHREHYEVGRFWTSILQFHTQWAEGGNTKGIGTWGCENQCCRAQLLWTEARTAVSGEVDNDKNWVALKRQCPFSEK